MLARLQKFVTFLLLFAALAWALAMTAFHHPGWAGAGALAILFGYAGFLALEFVLLYAVQQATPNAPRPRIAQLLRAWLGEIVVAPRVFLWRQPFRSRAEPDHLPASSRAAAGVVLVHGFVCNRGLWNPWMRALRKRGVPFIAVNLEPVFGPIELYAECIESAVARMESLTGRPVVLIGHSMGGLAIRTWLAQHGGEARVRRVITIGTPHRGTWLARFGRTHNGRQMRIANPWLAALASGELPAHRSRFTCFFGHCDNIVFPSATATLPDAENIHLPATAHVQMAFHPKVFDEALRWTL